MLARDAQSGGSMNATVAGIIGYVGLQILIGAWVSRRIATETDYMPAGRSFGVGLASVSIFATWFGAEVVIGAASRVYTQGISGAQAEPFAYAAGIMIMGLVFAANLSRRGIQTLADFFRFHIRAALSALRQCRSFRARCCGRQRRSAASGRSSVRLRTFSSRRR